MIESHLASYNEEEKAAISKDLAVVRSVCFSDLKKENSQSRPFYLATAGAPGARKSTILERFIKTHPEFENGAYLDPDQRALKFMVHTYYQRSRSAYAAAEFQKYALVQKKAYEKWRGASNYIALKLIEEAFKKRCNVIHGTTSTGGHIPLFFEQLHASNYKVVLVLCYCEDELRKEALAYRNNEQAFYQSTPDEEMSKGKLFSQKLKDYFSHADQMYLYWSDALFMPECLAAIYTEKGFTVMDSEAFQKFIDKYEQDRLDLQYEGIDIPSWQELEHNRY